MTGKRGRSAAEANRRERERHVPATDAILEREVSEFRDWQQSCDAVPVLAELRRRGEAVRRSEVAKVLRRLTPEQAAGLDEASTAILDAVLRPYVTGVRELAREGRADELRLVCGLLGLQDPDAGTPAPDASGISHTEARR